MLLMALEQLGKSPLLLQISPKSPKQRLCWRVALTPPHSLFLKAART